MINVLLSQRHELWGVHNDCNFDWDVFVLTVFKFTKKLIVVLNCLCCVLTAA